MTMDTTTISKPKNLLIDKASQILNQGSDRSSLNLSLSCSLISLQYKAENIKLYYPQSKSPLADYVLVVNANNTTQATAMAEMIMQFLRTNKVTHKVEGLDLSQWILIDIQNVLVHIFLPETRELYKLDDIYTNIPKIQIPEEYYSQVTKLVEIPKTNVNNFQDYL